MTCIHLRQGRICGGDRSEYAGNWVSPGVCRICPQYDGPARGLGDVIATAAKAVGVEPCGGCQRRREALNEIVPNPFKTG